MLSDKVSKALNKQITLEHSSANVYLSMAAWAAANDYCGTRKFFKHHQEEEMEHMEKIYNYVLDGDGTVVVNDIEKPKDSWESLEAVFEDALRHERIVTKSIFDLMQLCLDEKDFSTFEFLDWYASEQHEEEALVSGWLRKIEKFAVDANGLYLIDKEIGCSI